MAEPVNYNDKIRKALASEFEGREEERNTILDRASHITDVLAGKHPDLRVWQSDKVQPYSHVPEGVPSIGWEGPEDIREGDDEHYTSYGNIGDYYTEEFKDELPATAFNTGFYAGVLAVKAGLVDPEVFRNINDVPSVDPENTES